MDKLKNKKIIFIVPKYFGYEDYIRGELEKNQNEVILLYENLDMISLFYRLIYVYLPFLKNYITKRYYSKKILRHVNSDYVFIIRGSSLNIETMEMMRKAIKKECKFVLYQWDSVNNNSTALEIQNYFDKIVTFDYKDSKRYKWGYLPLFYIDDLITSEKKEIDILFVCGLHSNRAAILKKLKDICNKNNYSLEAKLLTNKYIYYKKKLIDRDAIYVDIPRSEVSFVSYDLTHMYKLYSKARVVVDYTHPNQQGFTMRTIECLGCKCKLITNNKIVLDSDFATSDNVILYEKEYLEIPEGFVKSEYNDIDNYIYEKYALSKWVETIFGGLDE